MLQLDVDAILYIYIHICMLAVLSFLLKSIAGQLMLSHACFAEPSFELHCRPASPSLSSKSRLSSSSVPEAVPFANITNTPASRAPAAAAPASQDDSHAAFGGKGAASRDASRRRSQGLENLQEQLQGVMMEGNQIQVGHVPLKQLLLLLLLLHQCS